MTLEDGRSMNCKIFRGRFYAISNWSGTFKEVSNQYYTANRLSISEDNGKPGAELTKILLPYDLQFADESK